MATTEIHPITTTPNKAINYAMSNKLVEINSQHNINEEVPYQIVEKNGKQYVRYFTITGFQNCNVQNPYNSFKEIQEKWQGVKYKNGGKKTKNGKEPVMYHLFQNFKGFEVSYEIANEIGRKLAEEVFKGFVVIISTHGNTKNVHNHIMISAWNEDGKKWNDCHKTKRQIRNVSDRLCEEYGLSVLEHTRDMRLISYKDKNGITRYYEPTQRKNEMIKQRKLGVITTDDVNSYRNTIQYDEALKIKVNNRTEIKEDIDAILPCCRNYEELLERLRELGYTIRDKKKNGDWLTHISFKSPTQSKATREDKIGDGKFYVRENLEKYIKEQAKKIIQEQIEIEDEVSSDNKFKNQIPFFEEYVYGKTNLDEIDNNYKTVYENGEYQTKKRTSVEKKILLNIRIKDSEVRGLIDTTQLYKLIAEQEQQYKHKNYYQNDTKEQKLVNQIQNSFRCLQYVERHNIFSYEQIIHLYSANKSKYNTTIDNFTKAEKAIEQLKEILTIPQKLSILLDKVECQKNDISYILEEYGEDKKNIEKYKKIMERYKIETLQGQKVLEKKIDEFEKKQNINRKYMASIIVQMSELENCIRTFDRIDSERGNKNMNAMLEFERIVKEQEEKVDNPKRENREKKGYIDR